MSNYEVDPNIKQILDLKNNKGVFPLTVDSAIIAHSPSGETTYLDSVVDYLYQQVANKLRLYTEQDGTYTKGKAYPATMGVQNTNSINVLQGTVNNYASILSALQQQVNNIDPTDDITSINNTIQRLWDILNNLSEASEYSYQEIKFSDSQTLPPSDLDNTTYWKNRPMDNPQHLWLGVRTITIKRGENGKPIITKGDAMIVSLQGPKGDRGERGERGESGTGIPGTPGRSYRPVLMYKWTNSRTVVPTTPTDPLNQGWTENPNNPEGENTYLWMTQNYIDISDSTYVNPTWSTPICLSGNDGVGADGAGIEFIFFRTNDSNANPNVDDLNAYKNGTSEQQRQFQTENFPFIGSNESNIVRGNQWTDNPQGIQLNNKYEWASFRESRDGTWSSFCAPFRWSMWGEDGIDGDGVEYIYYRSNEPNKWGESPIYGDTTDPRTWKNDANYQNSEYIRENTGWSDEPNGVGESNIYEYVSSRKKQVSGTDPHKKSWGEYSQPVVWAKFGRDGATAEQGLSGPVVRFRGEYNSNTTYVNSSLDNTLLVNNIRYIDVAFVVTNNQTNYYMVKPLQGGTRQTNANPVNSAEWELATGYSFIAAEALYARNAHIDNLSGYEFIVQDNAQNNYVVAGMTGGNIENSVVGNNDNDNPVRIWAGSRATSNIDLRRDNIPFKVFQDGKLKATNAEIKGNLSVDSLLLTGDQGSYYYNKTYIPLPKVDSNTHKVIFIITADNNTIVDAYAGDVLFAFSNNSMKTTNSTSLSTYKIYLAISINNGQYSGWLLQNLNALELQPSLAQYSNNISSQPREWNITSQEQGDYIKLYLRRSDTLCNFTTVNTSSYEQAADPVFNIGGEITFEIDDENNEENGKFLTTLHFPYNSNPSITGLGLNQQSGIITVGTLIDTYNQSDLSLSGRGSVFISKNNSNPSNDYIEISLPAMSYIDATTNIHVTSDINLAESFHYVITTNQNYAAAITTDIVSSNGFVIKDGSIVATDMPEGASVNIKDCIVYKDITETTTNEQYRVVNFGSSNVNIGNTILTPKSTIIVKAKPNVHIDFSDITAIDSSDIYDVDPVEPAAPINN